MARVRLLSEEEYTNQIAAQWREAKTKEDKLVAEYEIAERAYQCVSEGVQAGLDSGLATQYLFSVNNSENVMPLIEGLDLIKAVLFLHSKLCISDPVVQASARKQDPATKRATECAQAYLPYMRKRMKMQQTLEAGAYLNTCIYGTGITYNGWDTEGGDFPLDNFPEDPNELQRMLETGFKMEGDYDFRNVHPKKFFPDAAADIWDNAEHCFEEWSIPIEKAMYMFSGTDQQNLLRDYHKESNELGNDPSKKTNHIKIYHYFVKGRPWNGFLGAHSYLLNPEAPKLLTRTPNPFSHKKLPYSIISDIDIPDNVKGMSRIIYAYQTQLSINNLMYLIMKNTSLFGGNKMLMPEGGLNLDAMNNGLDDVAFFNPATGGKPEYIRPANVTSDVWRAYDIMKSYINNLYGMNEFSQGQVPRELSSYAVQLALEMDDKYRIRLFNKKKLFLQDIYYQGLENTKQYMNESRRLNVAGIESFTDDGYFMSSMLKGDYDIEVDYGQYLPVDPAARKQQILEFIKSGFFEKAGGDMKKAASLLIDGSMLDVKDSIEQHAKRQKAEIDRAIKGEKLQLHPWDNDEMHAAAVDEFTGTETFNVLPPELKQEIWEHGDAHVKRIAEKIAKGQGGVPGQPGAGGAPGQPPPAAPAPGSAPSTPSITQPTGQII